MLSNRGARSKFKAQLPWLAAGVLLLLLLALLRWGWWRGTAVGPQVQVPMFYDSHYVFPRAWTQQQEAPGVPDPFPLAALYGPNRVSQSFTSGVERLAAVEFWLAGPEGTAVQVSLADESETAVYRGAVVLDAEHGRYYRVRIPSVVDAAGRAFRLSLAAPAATMAQPVNTRAVGGDRLGGALWLNEYGRPGNLLLHTYSQGGGLPALAEQVLPDIFRLRVQQYKPDLFKGVVFPALLAATAVLSGLFLILARPAEWPLASTAGWSMVVLLVGLLLWQMGSGRLRFPGGASIVPLQPAAEPLSLAVVDDEFRIANDLVPLLWTAQREPEERFISTETAAGMAAIRAPARSQITYPLIVPPNGRFRTGVMPADDGGLKFQVRIGQEVAAEAVVSGQEPRWLEVDLAPWVGQSVTLALVTEPEVGGPDGLWLMPQVLVRSDWLLDGVLPPAATAVQARFGKDVALIGFQFNPERPAPGETALVTLYWQALARQETFATVFVHLLDEAGEIVAQHDAQPVASSYPLPNWQPGLIVVDRHPLALPPDLPPGRYNLAVGLYDAADFTRWPVGQGDGGVLANGRFLLPITVVIEASP